MERPNFNPFEKDETGQFVFDFGTDYGVPTSVIQRRHSHKIPEGETISLLEAIRTVFYKTSLFIERSLMDGRDKAIAQTKIDEARMWACSAAVQNSPIKKLVE